MRLKEYLKFVGGDWMIGLEAKSMGDLSVKILLLNGNFTKKSLNKNKPQSPEKKLTKFQWSTDFAPENNSPVLVTKMCTCPQ